LLSDGCVQETDDGEAHTLIVHIRKWFPGSTMKWLLTTNEDIEISSPRYDAHLRVIRTNTSDTPIIKEVEFTIMRESSHLTSPRPN